jgi:hypothetical protein
LYEIDLSSKHDEELRAALGTYVAHARKLGGAAPPGQRPHRPQAEHGRHGGRSRLVAGNGHDIKDRGRVPADLVAKYREAVG